MKKPYLLLCLVPLALAGSCKFLAKQLVDYTEYWPNGLAKTRGSLFGDKQSGEWTLSYESGRPLAKGTYVEDRQVGPWIFYYENGNVERSGSYDTAGLRSGEWLFKYEDQTPQARGSYIGDFEDGPWSFFGQDGAVTMAGQYDAGKQSGQWQFFYAGGRPKAEGLYYRGDRVGPWQVWDAQGTARLQDYGSKAGLKLVREVWPNGNVRRVGVLANGKPAGRWTSYHQTGGMRFCCTLNDGQAAGVFEARAEDGTVLAQGVFEKGAVAAGGLAVVNGVSRQMATGPLPSMPADVEPWAELASLMPETALPEAVVALLVAETKAAVGDDSYVAVVVTPAAPAPAVESVMATIDDAPMRMPAPAQPQLTVDQKKRMAQFVDEYENGPPPGGGGMGDLYAPDPNTAGGRLALGDGERSELVGRSLPFKIMKGVDGKDLDVTSYRGKQRVMIVVLRGFLGEVCCYCIAQTKALAKARSKLEQANIAVLVIYPGARENEASFRQLYEAEFGEGPPPYRVFYDPGLELVTQLGIEGDLASPTTLIIDKQGMIQYAYVGEHRADRPATNKLIEIIEDMSQ